MSSSGANSTGMPPVPAEWATEDRGVQIVAVFWAETLIASLFVAGRMWSRASLRNIGLDDWAMVLTLMAFIAFDGVTTKIACIGGFRHVLFIPPENLEQVMLLNLIVQVLAVLAYGASKFSVGYQLLRILPKHAKVQRWTVWILISLSLINNWGQMFLTFLQCDPPEAEWNLQLATTASCWSPTRKRLDMYIGSVFNVIVDFALAFISMALVWNLQLNRKKKIVLAILLGLGLFAGICAAIKLRYFESLFSTDPTWSIYDLNVWSGSEIFVIIVCGSIPPCKPLLEKMLPRSLLSNHTPQKASNMRGNHYDTIEMAKYGGSLQGATWDGGESREHVLPSSTFTTVNGDGRNMNFAKGGYRVVH